jgi:hypothetical protein
MIFFIYTLGIFNKYRKSFLINIYFIIILKNYKIKINSLFKLMKFWVEWTIRK